MSAADVSGWVALTRPCEDGERLKGGLQLGAVVLLGERADDLKDGVDDALLAQQRGSSVVS